jgi:hypothetical protein
MNIEIKRITNGWLLIISTPQGAEATFFPKHEECLAKIQKVMAIADNNLSKE